jgi:hypothetical protein
MADRMSLISLRRVELAGLFFPTRSELSEQVLVRVAEGVGVGRELRQSRCDARDDRAESLVAFRVAAPKLSDPRLISENSPWNVLSNDSFSMYLTPPATC